MRDDLVEVEERAPAPGGRTYTIAEIVAQTGGQDRTLRFWADRGALRAEPNTNGAGRGVHRQFSMAEVEVAAVLVALAPYGIAIGVLIELAHVVRTLLAPEGPLSEAALPGLAQATNTMQAAARRGDAGKLILIPSLSPDEPFSYLISGADAPEITAATQHQKALLTIDLAECWKGLWL